MNRFRHLASLGAFALACAIASPAIAGHKEPPPLRIDPLVEQFMQTSEFWYPTLSPDGKHMAVVAVANFESHVIVMDTTTLSAAIIASSSKAKGVDVDHRLWGSPRDIVWLTDDLIGVNLDVEQHVAFDRTTVLMRSGERRAAVLALDGKVVRQLPGEIESVLRDDQGRATEWVLIRSDNPARWLDKVNVRTGESLQYDLDVPGWGMSVLWDAHGNPMLATVKDSAIWSEKTTVTTWYRENLATPWRKIDVRSAIDDDFLPVGISSRPGHLQVRARRGGDRFAIWDYDVGQHAFGDKLAGNDTDDVVAGEYRADTNGFTNIVTEGLKPQVTWLDPEMARLQGLVDEALPGRNNSLFGKPAHLMLVYSSSDVDPGRVFIFDPAKLKMRKVLNVRPAIDPDRMQPMQTLHYPGLDGLQIPAYLTLPGKPTKPSPLIVLIHGGPIARDHWHWDQDVQLLAAHGYAVFQPQFRGSSGFGEKFERAGYRQFGLAMQDDVTAGVRYLIDQKIADPRRICIVGTSYGGYAALWGLEKTPELYKCGVSTSGPSDIEAEVTSESAGSTDGEVLEAWRETIGDPKQMHDIWASVSPRLHADRIKVPLLLVHGDHDGVVPISHGKKMRDVLEDQNKDVEWLDFEAEGHGVLLNADRRIWFGAMLELFARTIGEGDPPFPPTEAVVKKARDLATENQQEMWTPRAAAPSAAASQATASSH